jgi:hypothetical protein
MKMLYFHQRPQSRSVAKLNIPREPNMRSAVSYAILSKHSKVKMAVLLLVPAYTGMNIAGQSLASSALVSNGISSAAAGDNLNAGCGAVHKLAGE